MRETFLCRGLPLMNKVDEKVRGKSRILVLDAEYSRVDEAVERILWAFPLDWKGKKVLLKPNLLGPYPPEKGITTHPSLIRSLVRALRGRGATCWVGDNPGMSGYAANERCARVSGILEAAEGAYVNLAKDPVEISGPSIPLGRLVVSRAVLEADLVVNLPKFKTHVQTRITGAVKNMFGILVGAEKARVHLSLPRPRQFSEALVDIYRIRVPDLTVMDAVVGMEGNGPSSRDLRSVGKILASPNGVSLDGLMAAMMGFSPESVDYLDIAGERGMGEIDPARMEIQGNWGPLANFRSPLPFISRGWVGTFLNRVLYRPLVKPRLRVRPELCRQCGVCVEHCPAKALSPGGIPRLEERKCISCYCCYELCPSQAMELTRWMRWASGGKK